MDLNFLLFLVLILSIWSAVLTFLLVRMRKTFSLLREGVGQDLEKKGFAEVKKRLSFLELDAKKHTQKVSLVRFNPFKELGGDHSFCLAILDGEDTGVLITSLHTRDRTRVYMKDVKNGLSNVELSSEEKKALRNIK